MDSSILNPENTKQPFDFEEFISNHRFSMMFFLFGLLLVGGGIFWVKGKNLQNSSKIEVINEGLADKTGESQELVVEISGSVEKPGVYKLKTNDRVEDLLIASGGLSQNADRDWVEKYVNRAAKLTDGQKVFIPAKGEQTTNSNKQSDVLSAKDAGGDQTISTAINTPTEGYTNINTQSQQNLEKLPGIGPVYAQRIIEQRPYSKIEDLLTKEVIPQKTFDKIKNQISVF